MDGFFIFSTFKEAIYHGVAFAHLLNPDQSPLLVFAPHFLATLLSSLSFIAI